MSALAPATSAESPGEQLPATAPEKGSPGSMPYTDVLPSSPSKEGLRLRGSNVSSDAQVTATTTALPWNKRIMRKRVPKAVQSLPLLHKPERDPEGPWHHEEHKMNEWMPLFQDLAVVAVLTAFGKDHELKSPEKIPNFFAYYIIIFSMWYAHTTYVIRYEADDKLHRLFRLATICVFVYVGASSGGWDLANIREWESIPGISEDDASTHDQATSSFLTVVLSGLALRVMLIIQYTIVMFAGHKVGRPRRHILYPIISLIISAVAWIIAASIPATTDVRCRVKIAILYLGIFWEIVSSFGQVVLGFQIPARPADVSECFGSLTLVMLGEGFVGVTKAFQNALAGIGYKDGSLYAHVFLVISILYFIWGFFFSHFDKDDGVDAGRSWVWELLHLPLLFCLLLLLASLVNVVTITAWGDALLDVVNEFGTAINTYAATGQRLDSVRLGRLSNFLSRIDLVPDFQTQYETMVNLIDQTKNMTVVDQPGVDNFTVLEYQYLLQIVVSSAQSAAVDIPKDVWGDYYVLLSSNTTNPVDDALYPELSNIVFSDVGQLANGAYSGARWLFPAAGVVLILCAFRSLTRYHFEGLAQYVVNGMQILFGIVLALLGLLNIGPKDAVDVDRFAATGEDSGTNPMYNSIDAVAAIPTVFAFYAIVTFGSSVILWAAARKEKTKAAGRRFWSRNKKADLVSPEGTQAV